MLRVIFQLGAVVFYPAGDFTKYGDLRTPLHLFDTVHCVSQVSDELAPSLCSLVNVQERVWRVGMAFRREVPSQDESSVPQIFVVRIHYRTRLQQGG